MKRIAVSLLFGVLFSAVELFAAPPDSTARMPLFRNIPWNVSLEYVRENETAYYLQKFTGFGVETISFKDETAGLAARIDYTFKNNKFTEGACIITADDDFKDDLILLLKFLSDELGRPGYRSGPLVTSDSIWTKENDYGSYHGPSFYWQYGDGFVALISRKFEDDISITVLYAHGSSLARYVENNGVETGEFRVSFPGEAP